MAVPKLRFKRDDGADYPEWKERKLLDFAKRITRKNEGNVCKLPLTISAQFGLIDQIEFFNRTVASKDMSTYYLLMNGEFAYNKSIAKGYPVGAIKRLDRYDVGAVSPLYLCFKLNGDLIHSDFAVQYFETDKWHSGVFDIAQEGARNHGLLNVSVSDFFETVHKLPSDIEEQQKIADFLSDVDTLITTSEQELLKLKELKKGCLQKMFPRGDADVPEVRFPGFTGAWERRKLGDEFQRVNERNDGSFGREHWISVAKMYFQDPDKVQSNNLDTRTYIMRYGDIAFEGHPNSEFKFGRFVANDIGDGIISELFPIYRHKNEYDNSYWKYAIQIERIMRPIYAKAITSSGASSNKLNEEHFLRESIFVPNLEEQKAIGTFFADLDNLIALHQRECEKYKELKKGLLQQMFV